MQNFASYTNLGMKKKHVKMLVCDKKKEKKKTIFRVFMNVKNQFKYRTTLYFKF